jgi:hypothetical protein
MPSPFAYGVSHALTNNSILCAFEVLSHSRKPRPIRGGGSDDCRRTGAPFGLLKAVHCTGLTPKLTGAEARSAKGTDMGHEHAEGMAHVGVRLTDRLGWGAKWKLGGGT